MCGSCCWTISLMLRPLLRSLIFNVAVTRANWDWTDRIAVRMSTFQLTLQLLYGFLSNRVFVTVHEALKVDCYT